MRLTQLQSGQALGARVMLAFIRLLQKGHVPDVLKLMKYRPDYFGEPFCILMQDLLRGPSDWSVGERELFAAWVAQINRCQFCLLSHAAVASIELGEDTVAAVLARDWEGMPASLTATLTLLEALTRAPDRVTPADVSRVLATGVSLEALDDAAAIAAAFAVITRLADAFGFEEQTTEQVAAGARMLLARGYLI